MKKNYTRVMRTFADQPWALLSSKLETICGIIEARVNGAPAFTTKEVRAHMGGQAAMPGATLQGNGTIAVIPLVGILAPKMNLMTNMSGGTSLEQFRTQLARAVSDQSVKAIVIAVDSPGGSATGCEETWNAIMAARGTKPIVASVEYLMGSAALWIGSACDAIEIAPSGEAGSLGVYCVHVDESEAHAEAGLKLTYIVSAISPFKTEGNTDEPLGDDARAYFQARVNNAAQKFLTQVAKGRGLSTSEAKKNFGGGRTLTAADAVKAKMADRVATFEETVARLMGSNSRKTSLAASADVSVPLMAGHTDVGRDADGTFHPQCECDPACPCMQDGPGLCPDDCMTCQPTCTCINSDRMSAERATEDQRASEDAQAILAALGR